jgi:hypothetical protein
MTSPTVRFLTPAAKRRELGAWRALRDRLGCQVEQGGFGLPDPAMVPWCDRLNRIPGVCTLQSCSGHLAGDYRSSGHVWLWLSENMSAAFDARAFALSAEGGIERVFRVYAGSGIEVTVIEFQGQEAGRLDASMRVVVNFLSRLQSVS